MKARLPLVFLKALLIIFIVRPVKIKTIILSYSKVERILNKHNRNTIKHF